MILKSGIMIITDVGEMIGIHNMKKSVEKVYLFV